MAWPRPVFRVPLYRRDLITSSSGASPGAPPAKKILATIRNQRRQNKPNWEYVLWIRILLYF